jgi:ribonuclease-3
MNDELTRTWVADTLGHEPRDIALFVRALTHASYGPTHYERLEFLGDRVLGVVVATWLFDLFPDEPEGKLSRRLNVIVSRESCAGIGREIGVATHMRLGKQAREDGAINSDNVLGDVVEALIGALYVEGGLPAATAFVRKAWAALVTGQAHAPKHPKSALQEWAAAHGCRAPVYTMGARTGPHHAPRFTITVSIPGRAEISAEGTSKQEAETAAAKALLEKLS